MKLSRKLVMVSVAALMGVSPVVAGAINPGNVVQAASTVHKTYGKNSKVVATKTMYFVDRSGKKTDKKAYKGGSYVIWDVTKINGKLYYGIQTNYKYWLPASATKGSVQYKENGKLVKITNGKVVAAKKSSKKVAKKATKKVAKKNTKKVTKKVAKKVTKKSTKKISSKAIKPVKLETTAKVQVVDQNGKAVKSYMGSKKNAIIGKNVKLNGLGTKTIKGKKYYALKPNHYYIKASAVKVGK
ncbi:MULTISPECIES: hypothetical protein [Lactobacillus]|uniref:Surface layer protein A domain-containing protein n=1 Tax=Lactobacillus xujianguonis TaxID=2495899 RepID=A0A437ST99_9LACO|nr:MULTISPECIES: hypothetical protein [Lactobacillus]RVU70084.1 hypothetical protein EJK17_09405 [Lactobacillus xujianguonis]RVU73718.1 hypothetical protein EJK20_06675 [Lactobacillus xujianguonis]